MSAELDVAICVTSRDLPGVEEAAGALADTDQLKGILNDTAVTIDAELLRYARGDLLG